MATSDLIQKLYASDETGVGEDGVTQSNRRRIERFRVSEQITAGATVSLDVSQASNGQKAFIVAEADASDYIPVGVFDSSTDSDDPSSAGDVYINVVTRGIVEEALTKGDVTNISAGDRLTFGTAGKLVQVQTFRSDQKEGSGGGGAGAVAQPDLVVAIALEATSADATSRVYVLPNWA